MGKPARKAIQEIIARGLAGALKARGFTATAAGYSRRRSSGAVDVVRVPVDDVYGPTGNFMLSVGVFLPHVERLLDFGTAEAEVGALEPEGCTAYQRFGPAHIGGALRSWRVGAAKIADVSDHVLAVWTGAVDPWLATLGDDQALHRSLGAGTVVLRDPLAPVAVALLVGDKGAAAARLSRVSLVGGGRVAERAQRLAAEHDLTVAQAAIVAQHPSGAPDDQDDFVTAPPPPQVAWVVPARPDRVADPSGPSIIVEPGLVADEEVAPVAGGSSALDDTTAPLAVPKNIDRDPQPVDFTSLPIEAPAASEEGIALVDVPTPRTGLALAAQAAPVAEPAASKELLPIPGATAGSTWAAIAAGEAAADEDASPGPSDAAPPAAEHLSAAAPAPVVAAPAPVATETLAATDEITPAAEDTAPFADAELLDADAPIDAEERAVVVAWDPPWGEDAPPPLVITVGRRTILLYQAKHPHAESAPIALAEFRSVTAQRLVTCPRAVHGVGGCAAHKVERSTWIAERGQLGDGRDAPERASSTHYLLSFRDHTFECLAHDHSVEVLHTSMAEALVLACRRLQG